MKKVAWIFGLIIIVIFTGIIWYKFFFVFGEGVKAGSLNYFVKKGVIFKTYEGRVVQEGFQSPNAGELQSNEFRFSVTDEKVAEQLERSSGKFVELRYEEFNGMLPWRGTSNFLVIEVLTVKDSPGQTNTELPFSQ
ncbi:hypothetical protein [Algoriphagus sediminis]|uniref:6-phosphogluconate dehydrogenase n=1 Tax=Algoriphagus sediminis TaxID=3057113 RepID=A0ABT7Y9X0_9BACT|nr:hypothetical protein [Algoriphagus sediminis]MDN3203303.1 hypothetical protein [Algoriphagus sediminis]